MYTTALGILFYGMEVIIDKGPFYSFILDLNGKEGYLPNNFANFIQISIINEELTKRDLPQFKKAKHQKDILQTSHLAKLTISCDSSGLFIQNYTHSVL